MEGTKMCKPIIMKDENSIVELYRNTVFMQSVMNEEELTKEKIDEISADCSVTLPEGSYRVVFMNIDHAYRAEASYENMRLVLTSLISDISSEYGYIAIAAKISDKYVLALLYERPRERFRDIDGLFSRLMERFLDLTGCTVTVGISSYFSKITDIPAACKQAEEALSQRIILGNNRVISYRSVPEPDSEQPRLFVNDLQMICDQIRRMNAGHALAMVDEYFHSVSKFHHINIADVRSTVLMLAMLLLHDEELGGIAESAFSGGFDPAEELDRCELLSEIRSWIIDVIQCISGYMSLFINGTYSRLVRDAIIYTMQNLDKPLTTSAVADHLQVSPNHFMRIFKKEFGTTYGEYLAEHRIAQAKKLLKTNKYKIYEVGDMVGYPNTAYFNRLFKKYTGHNPGYYCKGGDRRNTA